MDKLKMQSPNLVDKNIGQIAKLFPNCVTERQKKDEDGRLVFDREGKPVIEKGVDFDLLRQELSGVLIEGKDERYRIDWAGKRQAILTANSPIAKTLRPCREESVNFDTTENLYIEGDNLDVLKLLHETYLGKVKMIYIDPPYNTHNNFIYKDDFSQSAEEYLASSNQMDDQGNRLFANKETSGRYHSDWLSMMCMRLKLARDLLAENGAIFISIDDNEVHNLRKICDEIFGEENFIADIIWKHTKQSKNDERHFSRQYNNTILYAKNIDQLNDFYFERTTEDNINYSNPDNDPKGLWRSGDVRSPNYRKTLCFDIIAPNGNRIKAPENGWRWSEQSIKEKIETGEIKFKPDNLGIIRKIYLCDQIGRTPENIWDDDKFGTTRQAAAEIKALFDNKQVFDTPKPKELVISMMNLAADKDSIILDFFSGSATTAHAVMQLNAEDGGNRKFIMVQLDEKTDPNSDAYKAGYKNICEIGKERIRRAGQKIKAEYEKKINFQMGMTDIFEKKPKEAIWMADFSEEAEEVASENLDIGFRVLKLADSNMKDVYYNPKAYNQDMLLTLDTSIKEDRTAEDILFQVMLDKGVSLSSKIEKRITANGQQTYYIVGETGFGIIDLICCLDKKINTDAVKEIAKLGAECVVFLDSGIASDATRTNIQQLFDTYSPKTKVEVI